mmetsp:Transcript_30340/g.72701  ORF Transcript_30340/g.72701 Transcript_30340/m.72701 type:complete len:163 (+) Transcript_30340:79-567(+)
MISNTQQKMEGYTALNQKNSVDKAFSFELKADPTRLEEGESDSDSLCKFSVPPKRKLSFQLQSNKPLSGKLQASFGKITADACGVSEPAPKRRRFQRRNSQTAKMLSMSMLPVLALDFAGKEKTRPSCPEYDEDIGIAEDLVRRYQASRKRAQPMGFSLVQS